MGTHFALALKFPHALLWHPRLLPSALSEWLVPADEDKEEQDPEEGTMEMLKPHLYSNLLFNGFLKSSKGLGLSPDTLAGSLDADNKDALLCLIETAVEGLDNQPMKMKRVVMALCKCEQVLAAAVQKNRLTREDIAAGDDLSEMELSAHILSLKNKYFEARDNQYDCEKKLKDQTRKPDATTKNAELKLISKLARDTPKSYEWTQAQVGMLVSTDPANNGFLDNFEQVKEAVTGLLDGTKLEQVGARECDQAQREVLVATYLLGHPVLVLIETNQVTVGGDPVSKQVTVPMPELDPRLHLIFRSEPAKSGVAELLGPLKDFHDVLVKEVARTLMAGKPMLDMRMPNQAARRLVGRSLFGKLTSEDSSIPYTDYQLDTVMISNVILGSEDAPTDTELLHMTVLENDLALPSLTTADGVDYRPPFGFSSAATRIVIATIGPALALAEIGDDSAEQYARTLEYFERYKFSEGKRTFIEYYSQALRRLGEDAARARGNSGLMGNFSIFGAPNYAEPQNGFGFLDMNIFGHAAATELHNLVRNAPANHAAMKHSSRAVNNKPPNAAPNPPKGNKNKPAVGNDTSGKGTTAQGKVATAPPPSTGRNIFGPVTAPQGKGDVK